MNRRRGFTLMEMLIVVAIIAVLVAIMIPSLTASLEKSREATDMANVRSAYAEVVIAAHTKDTSSDYYDASTNTYSKTIDVIQVVNGWSTNGEITIGGISSERDLNVRWIGEPQKNGTCTITYYVDQSLITIDWNNG